MRKPFSILPLLILGLLLLTLIPNGFPTSGSKDELTIYADWITYQDQESLVRNSEAILSGEIINVDNSVKVPIQYVFPDKVTEEQKEAVLNSGAAYDLYTVSEVRVDKVIKGEFKEGDTIKVYQLGGENEKLQANEANTNYYKKGNRYLLFATRFSNDTADKYKVLPINAIQGEIQIINGKTKVHKDNRLFKSDLSEADLVKTIKEKIR